MKTPHSFDDEDDGTKDNVVMNQPQRVATFPVVTQAVYRLADDFEQIRMNVSECTTVAGFLDLYDRLGVVSRRIRVAMGCRSPDEFAADWAIASRLNGQNNELKRLNEDRKTLLSLVFRIADCIYDSKCNDVTIQSIERDFKTHRLMNILQLVVPMDRAQCLYKMQYTSVANQRNQCGMHWVAKTHVDSSRNWGELLRAVQGRPTINKRLVFLHQTLPELQASPALTRWLTPQLALWW